MTTSTLEEAIDESGDRLDQVFEKAVDLGQKRGEWVEMHHTVEAKPDFDEEMVAVVSDVCDAAVSELNYWIGELSGVNECEYRTLGMLYIARFLPTGDQEKLENLLEPNRQTAERFDALLDSIDDAVAALDDLIDYTVEILSDEVTDEEIQDIVEVLETTIEGLEAKRENHTSIRDDTPAGPLDVTDPPWE